MLPLLRAVAILIGLGVIGSAVAWLVTGRRVWRDRALWMLGLGVVVGFVFFGVLALQRLME